MLCPLRIPLDKLGAAVGISALRGDLEHFYKAKMLQLLKDGGLGGVANQVG
jgi:hypothetical protein